MPSVLPKLGCTAEMLGVGSEGIAPYVKPSLRLPTCVPWVTVTATAPLACAGLVHWISVGEITTMLVVGDKPKLTSAPGVKFCPVTIQVVPPPTIPDTGDTELTIG